MFAIDCYIVTYRRPLILAQAVESFQRTSPHPLTVMDTSGDSSEALQTFLSMTGHTPHASVVPHANGCLARVFNTCIRRSQSPWVLISNDDVVFQPGWFDALAADVQDVLWAGPSYCFAFNMELLSRVGWFDENYIPAGYEDADYYLRMCESKVPIRYGVSRNMCHRHASKFCNLVTHLPGSMWSFDSSPARDYFCSKWGTPGGGREITDTNLRRRRFPEPKLYPDFKVVQQCPCSTQ